MGANKLGIFLSAARGGGQGDVGIGEIQQDDVTVATFVTILNFEGPAFNIIDEGLGKVTVQVGRIVTHQLTEQLSPLPNGPLVVVDNNGDVVRSLN